MEHLHDHYQWKVQILGHHFMLFLEMAEVAEFFYGLLKLSTPMEFACLPSVSKHCRVVAQVSAITLFVSGFILKKICLGQLTPWSKFQWVICELYGSSKFNSFPLTNGAVALPANCILNFTFGFDCVTVTGKKWSRPLPTKWVWENYTVSWNLCFTGP